MPRCAAGPWKRRMAEHRVTIDHLVLNGVPRPQQAAVRQAVEQAMARAMQDPAIATLSPTLLQRASARSRKGRSARRSLPLPKEGSHEQGGASTASCSHVCAREPAGRAAQSDDGSQFGFRRASRAALRSVALRPSGFAEAAEASRRHRQQKTAPQTRGCEPSRGEDKETSGRERPCDRASKWARPTIPSSARRMRSPPKPSPILFCRQWGLRERHSPAARHSLQRSQPLCIRRRCAACGGEEENARARASRSRAASRVLCSANVRPAPRKRKS